MIIGLTGGIASGKSTLSTFFEQKGCFVIDADKIAHEVTGKNSEGANKIKQAFGEEFFDNGVLNRKKLAEHVFASADKTKVLNQIIHPLVISRILSLIDASTNELIVLDVPLLFESELDKKCDKTICVFCGEENQISRAIKRSHYSKTDVENRIKNQLSQQEKIARSNYAINTSGTKEQTLCLAEKIFSEIKNELS